MSPRWVLLRVGFAALALSVFAVPYASRRVAAWISPPVALRAHGFVLEESAAALGIRFVHERPALDPRLEPIAPVVFFWASVSVADVDGDGWPDLYVTTSRVGAKNRLYLNRQGQGFEDVADTAGLADLNRPDVGVSTGSAWADYDNDGDEDLLLLRLGRLELFRNDGALKFVAVTREAGLADQRVNASDAVWLDVDRDGCLDVYVGAYFRPETDLLRLDSTRIWWDSVTTARNGGRNRLYRQNRVGGRCTGTFREVAAQLGIDDPGWTVAVGAADLDDNGFVDLYVANDVGPDSLFLNVDGQRFESGFGGPRDSKKGMNVAFGDFRNSGRLGVYVTNITKPGYLVEGNMLWEDLGGGRWRDVAWERGVADGGWGWGAQFGDLNNDGHLDIFAANGMISGDPKRDYWYDLASISRAGGFVLQDLANWAPLGGKSLSGFETARVFLNDGTGRYREVARDVGVRSPYDGRGVALVDFDRNGTLDVAVANFEGPLLVYRNRVDPDRAWIQFELRGTRSNRNALGARVTLYWNGQRQVQEVGRSGFAGHGERTLHFGLGRGAAPERVEIRWPSGVTEVRQGLEVNRRHVLVEPAQ